MNLDALPRWLYPWRMLDTQPNHDTAPKEGDDRPMTAEEADAFMDRLLQTTKEQKIISPKH